MRLARLRTALALVLAALVVAASLPMAVARAGAPLAGLADLCTSAGSPEVADAGPRGRPSAPAGHSCPDCLPHLPALALPAAPCPARPAARGRRAAPLPPGPAGARPCRRPRVRDPPATSV